MVVEDGYIDFCSSDVFFGLDMQHHVIPYQADFYKVMRKFGVRVYFLIHDLLPVLSPKFFPPDTYDDHTRWLKVLSESADGLVCVSKTVSTELKAWLLEHAPVRTQRLAIGWSHNGADIEQSMPSTGLPDNAGHVLNAISRSVTFLTVSTIEPRKGHSQILDAAEQLWEAGCDVCIVFVGKQGWNVEALVERINGHKYLGKKLFWLNGISDEYLGMVYKNSSCLIAASWGEGFGLPIVEAALNGIPMIVRDIPVHREVAGNNVVYFSGGHASDLGNAMASWIDDFRSGTVLSPDDINVLDWNQSAASLMQVILCEKWSDFLDVNL
jgi:glycosyltransferase involved in cell wall biosynthesis